MIGVGSVDKLRFAKAAFTALPYSDSLIVPARQS